MRRRRGRARSVRRGGSRKTSRRRAKRTYTMSRGGYRL